MGGDPPNVMFDNLIHRRADLWCIFIDGHMYAAGVVGIRNGNTVRINAFGGREMKRWLHLFSEYEDLARKHGMKEIEIEGRPGWRRVLPGYRVRRVILGRVL